MAPTMRLTYFDFPARAEPARLMLTLANLPFEDVRVSFGDWPAMKPTAGPYNELPLLEVDGKVLAQSRAIDHYIAKKTGMYPEDEWEAALVEQHAEFVQNSVEELWTSTAGITDPDEKIAARKKLLAGKLGDNLAKLESILGGREDGSYLVGKQLTYADVACFCLLSGLISGMVDGIPTDLFSSSYPNIDAFRKRIASEPGIAAYYAKEPHASNPLCASYRP